MMGGSGASRPPRTELDSFVIELVRAYPRAVISTDGGERIPLTDAIYDWIEFSSKDTPLGVGGGMGVGGVGEDGMMGAGGGVDQDGNNAGGRFGDRPSNPSNLGMGSARGGSERLVSNVGSDRLEGMSELMGQNDNDPTQRRNTGDSTHTGRRLVLDNISYTTIKMRKGGGTAAGLRCLAARSRGCDKVASRYSLNSAAAIATNNPTSSAVANNKKTR
jgi:hypothetical protein